MPFLSAVVGGRGGRRTKVAKISDQVVANKLAELKTPEQFIKYARAMGLSDEQIIQNATRSMSAVDVAAFARKYSQALGLTFVEIRRIAGPRS